MSNRLYIIISHIFLISVIALGFFVISVIFLKSQTRPVSAAAGDIVITVTEELTNSLSSSSATIACTGGTDQIIADGGPDDADATDNGVIVILSTSIDDEAANCDINGEAFITQSVGRDGYITAQFGLLSYSTIAQNNGAAQLPFSHKLRSLNELGDNLIADSATAGANNTPCVILNRDMYCPVPLNDDNDTSFGFVVLKDGYITTVAAEVPLAGDRTSDTDAQQFTVMDASNGLDFSHKVIIEDEIARGLNFVADSATAGLNNTVCVVVVNEAYCPIPLADDDDFSAGFVVAEDGYVTTIASDVPLNGDRTADTDAQQVTAMDSTNGLKFSHKIFFVNELNTPVSIAGGVSAGASGVSCRTDGPSAYCPILLADDDVLTNGFVIVVNGYVTTLAADVLLAGDRTSGSDSQKVLTMDSSNGLKFSHIVIIKDELNNNLMPESVTVGPGGTTSCDIIGNIAYCMLTLANDNIASNGYTVFKNGYITSIPANVPLSGDRTLNSDPQQVTTMTSLNGLVFSHKVVIVDELGTALTPTSVTAGSTLVNCSISGNSAYCPISISADHTASNGFVIVKDGYVTSAAASVPLAGNRAANTDPQQVAIMTSANGLDFAYKITSISSESLATNLTASVTTLEVGDATGRNACTLSTDTWYCPVVLANSNGTLISRVIQDGYVEKTNYALTAALTRTLGTTAQRSDTIVSIQYGVKVTLIQQTVGTAITGATVTDSAATVTCAENGVTGVYFCLVPLANTERVVAVSKSGFQSDSAPHTDRTAHTDAQQAIVFALIPLGSGGNGGGGGTPAPVSVPEPTPTPATNINTPNIVDLISLEKNIVFNQANPETYFINTGTDSTVELGSGERGAAVSSFKEAYGRSPSTSADWTDILNIANGRWPITVNKTVEARAYINFRLVFGRNANMQNSIDVNWLKMAGYGVRGHLVRNLNTERTAISRFRDIFGFNPTTARHWNIMRAIAYSGLVK